MIQFLWKCCLGAAMLTFLGLTALFMVVLVHLIGGFL